MLSRSGSPTLVAMSVAFCQTLRPACKQSVLEPVISYIRQVPKLWNQTIETHRAAVHAAILATTAALVTEHGLRSVTMSQIATATGIGRATLYKYFSDVEAILLAWHHEQITAHLGYLVEVRDRVSDPGERLGAVLEAYALLSQGSHAHHDTELAAFMHGGDQLAEPQQQLHRMIRDLVTAGASAGKLRDDVAADELASYCLHAVSAAGGMTSKVAVRRLVSVILAGLQPAASQVHVRRPLDESPHHAHHVAHGHREHA